MLLGFVKKNALSNSTHKYKRLSVWHWNKLQTIKGAGRLKIHSELNFPFKRHSSAATTAGMCSTRAMWCYVKRIMICLRGYYKNLSSKWSANGISVNRWQATHLVTGENQKQVKPVENLQGRRLRSALRACKHTCNHVNRWFIKLALFIRDQRINPRTLALVACFTAKMSF